MLKIYNTLSRKAEEFKPLRNKSVSFYQCGPTVYWTQHIGNMRAMVLADLIRRSLVYLGYKVKFARNYTDVGHLTSDADEGEDKMMKAARRDKLTPEEVAQKYIVQFEDDITALNCLPPDYKPRATEYIDEMAKMVQVLLDKGYAYATELAIYFDISKFENYTQLSGQKLDMNQAEAGKGEVSDKDKKNSADFAVWLFKAGTHKDALQAWEKEFVLSDGQKIKRFGFPGWHLECSAMNLALFGLTIDLHMGGIEHIPVHHTNEIAQSEAANGAKFVNYWLHNEHLTVDGGKMSKSQGTGYSLDEIREKEYDPLALRYLFLQAHYRSKQNFTWEALEGAASALKNLKEKIIELKNNTKPGKISQEYKDKFLAVLADDFNIPQALAIVWDIFKSEMSDKDKYATLLDFDEVLGLDLAKAKAEEIPGAIKAIAEKRWQAKADKDFTAADGLRKEIEAAGYIMEDGKDGYKLKRK